jgi:phospholipid/cholesterol/gamma-HCH transport system substrate-binding protein
METKANYVAVGVFVLVCVLGLVVALLWLGGAQYSEEYAYYQTSFTGAVTGLGTGTPVRYNGITVGTVSKLNFDPDDPKKVIVIMQLAPTLNVHADSVASIASEGLTGGSYVEIDGGSKASPILRPNQFGDYPIIRSKPSTLQELEQSAPQLLAKINGIADRLNDVLSDKNRQAFGQTLVNLRDATAVFARRSADFDKIIVNFSSASVGIDKDVGVLHDDLTALHGVLAHADLTTQKLNHLTDDADTAINNARVDQIMSEARELVRSLTRLSDQFEHEPTRLIYGDRRKGYTPP